MRKAERRTPWVLLALLSCAPALTPARTRSVDPEAAPPTTSPSNLTTSTGAPTLASVPSHCLEAQLTPYIESIGRGWPPAYRPSGVVLVADATHSLYAHGFGAADRERGIANTPDTSFRIGSISKVFAAVAILQLVEQGKLNLGGRVRQYLPEYPSVGADITLHQLLSHTSGLRSYNNDARLAGAVSTRDILASFWNEPLAFPPGTGYEYSNSGYAVLGAIVERISGLPYASYLQRHVLAPAGMNDTMLADAEGVSDRAIGYQATPKGDLVPAPSMDLSIAFAAGGLRSTAHDLAAWHTALQRETLLSEASRRLMYTPVQHGYAYGWMVNERQRPRVVSHGGVIAGFNTSLARIPELGLAIIVLLNSEALPAYLIAEPARRCALGEELQPRPVKPLVELAAADRARLVGTFVQTERSRQSAIERGVPKEIVEATASVQIVEDDGALFFEMTGQRQLLLAQSSAELVLPAILAELEVRFAEGPAARASQLSLRQGGDVVEFERRPGCKPRSARTVVSAACAK